MSRLYIVTLLIRLICRVHHVKCQVGIKIAGRNINNLRYADDTTLMAESEEELKSLLMKVKEESEKAGLKLNKGLIDFAVLAETRKLPHNCTHLTC